MRSPERACARARVPPHSRAYSVHALRDHQLDRHGELPVLQLADVEVAVDPVEGVGDAGPAEEDVALGLHQVLPGDDALTLVVVLAAPGILRQDRRLGLLGLQEQRLDAVAGVHQHDPGAGADAADPDDLAGHLHHGELLEQVPPVGLQGAPVLAQHGADQFVDRVGLHARRRPPRPGRSSAGWLMIRRCPSTTVVSLPTRLHAVAVCALASSFSASLYLFAFIWDRNSARAGWMSTCAYQTSMKVCSANPRIAVR